MLLIALLLAILVVSALLVVGIGARRYWALDVLNGLYALGLFYAIHLTVQVWRNPHPRARRARRLVASIMAVLIGLSLSPLVVS